MSFPVVYETQIASGTAIWSIEDFHVINTQLSHLVAGHRVTAHSGLKSQWVDLLSKYIVKDATVAQTVD